MSGALDLKAPQGHAALLELVAGADVPRYVPLAFVDRTVGLAAVDPPAGAASWRAQRRRAARARL
ncbi:MAG: hypothetical protein QM674_07385 [Burkholderiaceae bacterium]